MVIITDKNKNPVTLGRFDAAYAGNMNCIRYYIEECECDVNTADDNSVTLLTSACLGNKPEMVKYLLKKGADPNILTLNNQSPLLFSVLSRNDKIMNMLIKNGAQIDLKLHTGRNVVEIADMLGMEEYKEKLSMKM